VSITLQPDLVSDQNSMDGEEWWSWRREESMRQRLTIPWSAPKSPDNNEN
jgi:hypothetical protein